MHVPSQIMRQFQSMTRSGEARDFNLIQDNSAYVQNWSIAQAIVVILCTAVQVDGLSLFPFLYIIIVAGVLCQELLQRSKGRERGWQWVQDENLMLVKKFWLCFNRYSRPLCQCVLGYIQCYIGGKYRYQGNLFIFLSQNIKEEDNPFTLNLGCK